MSIHESIIGDASIAPDAPELRTLEEVENYCYDTFLRYRIEAQKLTPDNPSRLSAQQIMSAHRKSMMLFGRAIACPNLFYRLGLLGRSNFIRLYRRVTEVPEVPEQHLALLVPIVNRQGAKAFLDEHAAIVREKRLQTSSASSVADQHRAQARWLAHLGQFIEAIGILYRQRFIDEAAYEGYHAMAMATLVPTLAPAPRS